MRTVLVIAACLALAACASDASDFVPVGPNASPYGTQAALNECQAQSDSAPFMANAMSNPFGTAAMQSQFISDCMQAKGYAETQ